MDEVEVVEYKGHSVHIFHDEAPECPQEAWDTEPVVLASHWQYGRESVALHGSDPDVRDDGMPRESLLTDEVLRQHWRDVLPLGRIGYAANWPTLRAFLRDEAGRDSCSSADTLREYLERVVADTGTGERFATLAEVWRWCGVVALVTSTTGYCQGDYSDLLVIATPSFLNRTGASIEAPENLHASAELFGAWLWGDVYGYTITRPCGECGGDVDTGIGCWGFYGADREASGLLESARDEIDTFVACGTHAGHVHV